MTAQRTDTVTALPSARPLTPTVELLIPLKPEVPRTRYEVRRPIWVRRAPSKNTGLVVGSAIGTVLVASHVITSALTGSM